MSHYPSRCRHLETGARAGPIYSIIALDYYDGPTSGVIRCQVCSAEFKFMMLDWDDHQGNRVYSLEPLPLHSFKQIEDVLSKYELPKSPVWFPLRQYSSKQDHEFVEQQIAEILDQAASAIAVIAMSQWGETILAGKALNAIDMKYVRSWFTQEEPQASLDWFSFLGLNRSSS